jgi:hypothetical protein
MERAQGTFCASSMLLWNSAVNRCARKAPGFSTTSAVLRSRQLTAAGACRRLPWGRAPKANCLTEMPHLDFRTQALVRVGCCARMCCGVPCRTFLSRDASRRVRLWGGARSRSKRTVGVRNRRGLRAIFLPPTVSVETRTLTCGSKRNGRRPRRRSKLQVLARARTDACR